MLKSPLGRVGGKAIGTGLSLPLSILILNRRPAMSTIRDVLKSKRSSSVWRVTPETTVYDAVKLMSEKNIGALLVVDAGQVAGIMTERDYSRKIVLMNRTSRETKVSQIMTKEVLYVSPDDSVDGCMALMTERRIRHLPVFEEGVLIGLISIGDIVKSMVSDREFLIEQLTHYITGTSTVDTSSLYGLEKKIPEVRMIGE